MARRSPGDPDWARLLHCDVKQVRRLIDLDHQSTFSQLIDAAEVLGFEVDIDL
jgi:hypothetical protein